MEYRSPLGFNFKLEESLNASKEEKPKETPQKEEAFINVNNSGSQRFSDFDHKRNSTGKNFSPNWQRRSNNWKSPSCRNSKDEPVPIEQFYHPSMLEDPWEQLEKNLQTS